jgi:hypothetical protein
MVDIIMENVSEENPVLRMKNEFLDSILVIKNYDEISFFCSLPRDSAKNGLRNYERFWWDYGERG